MMPGTDNNRKNYSPKFGGILIATFVIFQLLVGAAGTSSSPPSIPRSTNSRSIYTESSDESAEYSEEVELNGKPPWNLSQNIDESGFFISKYKRIHGEWEHEFVDHDDFADDDDDYDEKKTMLRRSKQRNYDPVTPVIRGRYHCLDEPVVIRQVPGDGNCLFHSISVSMALISNRTHIDMTNPPRKRRNFLHSRQKNRKVGDRENQSLSKSSVYKHDLKHLHHHSRHLRSAAVDILSRHPRKLLFLQGNEYLRARDLVAAAAAQYGMTGKEYCEQMQKDSYWGGGPEIVALCNYLKRPIHVYELSSYNDGDENEDEEISGSDMTSSLQNSSNCNSQFQLRRMACFGSPKFDRREALHILSADSRFPDIKTGEQLASGNHFLALFPEGLIASVMEEEKLREKLKKKEKKRAKRADVRGGDVTLDSDSSFCKWKAWKSIQSYTSEDFDRSDDSIWSWGILKYVKIDSIWSLMRLLKVAFK